MKKILQSSRERANAIGQRRHEVLRRFRRLKKTHSATEAARIVGSSVPTLWRWEKRLAAQGVAGLELKCFKSGPIPFSKIRLTAKAVREIELLLVEQNSPRAAWQRFANFSPACPPLVAKHVQRAGKPPLKFAAAGCVSPVQARCYISADKRRLYVRLPARGTLTARLAVPTRFNLIGAHA